MLSSATTSPIKIMPESPFKLPKSASGGDIVSGIVGRFESLSVTDNGEEREKFERQITKLKAALDRAQIAREEAESEARKLREKLLDLQDERQKEKTALKERAQEYEKKYEKAKDRFKMQRVKNEDSSRKAQKELMETEKRHWRTLAMVQEETEWERKLRLDAQDLLTFVELERQFEAPLPSQHSESPDHESSRRVDIDADPKTLVIVDTVQIIEEITLGAATVEPEAVLEDPQIDAQDEEEHAEPAEPEYHADCYPSLNSAPRIEQAPFSETPRKQIITVPVDFGDDKENRTPTTTVEEVLKTPITIDRAAALAAIQYRRGRAKSFVQNTPRKVSMEDRRDVSAPPLVTMSVGRPK